MLAQGGLLLGWKMIDHDYEHDYIHDLIDNIHSAPVVYLVPGIETMNPKQPSLAVCEEQSI